MKQIILEIPGPPVAKERPRKGRYGNFYTPEKTRNYEKTIRSAFIMKYPRHKPWTGPVSMIITAHVKSPASRPDGSNILKSIEDALNGLAYRDDAQIIDARIVKAKAEDGMTPWVTIRVEEIRS